MAADLGPNWLIVVGMVYMICAFGLLGLSAVYRTDRGDARGRASAESQQRVAWAFASLTGIIGVLFQMAGNFLHLGEGQSAVLMLLSLIALLVGFVVFTFNMAEASRVAHIERRAETLSLVPSGTADAYGQAAE